MAGHPQLAHAGIRVPDREAAVAFYTDVMGLSVIESGEVTYLGCGFDENVDLAVTEGGTGVDHLAVRVDGTAAVEAYERRLAEHGVATSRHDGEAPNVTAALRFELPVGAEMELVAVADTRYAHADEVRGGGRTAATPLDVDHVTLAGAPVRETAEFLESVLDFRISEVLGTPDRWEGAFTRRGTNHHDVAVLNLGGRDPDEPVLLRHVAWKMANIEHMKTFIDTLAQAGHELEVSIHRHYAGNNLAAYFREPGGNRFEVCAEMAALSPDAPTEFTERSEGFTAWGGVYPPDAYREGT